MKEAIIKAVEGGWRKELSLVKISRSKKAFFKAEGYFPQHVIPVSDILLDPLFWQALGKVLKPQYDLKDAYWFVIWHRFVDKLASGGTAEEFFQTLLSNQKER